MAYLGQLCPKQPNKLNNNYRYYGNGYEEPVVQTQYIEENTKTYHKVNDCYILQLFNQITLRNNLIGTVRTKRCLTYITILLMAISNDVQLNPGPPNNNGSTNYGCGTCNQSVT